jgi:hypothetical protein
MTARRDDEEPFLTRWARLKREAAEQRAKGPPAPEPKPKESEAPPALPPIDQLSLESDFRQFFHPKVSEALRRAALKKLFSDPHFNTMDGLDVYIEDYSKFEPLPPEMLAALRQARDLLARGESDAAEPTENALREPGVLDAVQRTGSTERLARATEQSRSAPAESDGGAAESSSQPAAAGK